MKVAVINGPNLNLLGSRKTEVYGSDTLLDIVASLRERAAEYDIELSDFQSNSEGALVDYIQSSRDEQIDGILINPGAYTHTSIAMRDALEAVNIPFVEVHLTNIFAREEFRAHSYFSDIAIGVISGFGPLGYLLALDALYASILSKAK